jgi:transcriptional regulator GlxA family with amidase domain
MWIHLVFDGVADGPFGVGVGVVDVAHRVVRAGLARVPGPPRTLAQRVVSVDGRPVTSAAGRRIAVDGRLRAPAIRPGDVVVLAGIGAAASKRAVAAFLDRPDVHAALPVLAHAHARGARVAASCSATFVLAAAGLLEGREATTTWWLGEAFATHFPGARLCPERMVVEDRGVWTAGAALAHADLMLALLARTTSASLAHLVARYLVLDERPAQARYVITEHLRSADPVVRALEQFLQRHLARRVTLAEMAHATSTSPRTLARRVQRALGTSPLRLAQRLRVSRAAHLLETTKASVDEVAARVGYADPSAFRRIFRRETGTSPRARR